MKHIITLLTISSLVVLAGCASDPTSVNSNAGNTEALNENENAEVVVANTNAVVNTNTVENVNDTNNNEVSEEEIDTSDWLTYENEEYGFSFKYPEDLHVDDKTSIQVPGQYQLVITAGKSYDPNDYEFVLYIEQITLNDKYEQVKAALSKDANKELLSETSHSTISKTIKVKTISSNIIMTNTMVEIEDSVISYSCAESPNKSVCKPMMNTFITTI